MSTKILALLLAIASMADESMYDTDNFEVYKPPLKKSKRGTKMHSRGLIPQGRVKPMRIRRHQNR